MVGFLFYRFRYEFSSRLYGVRATLKGTCINCGTAYCGWALRELQHRICLKCGSLIKVEGYDKAEIQNSVWQEWVVTEERPSVGE